MEERTSDQKNSRAINSYFSVPLRIVDASSHVGSISVRIPCSCSSAAITF
jgi:hypothetical protein